LSLHVPEAPPRGRSPRRDAVVVVGAMVLLAAAAWVYLVWMPVDGMARGILTRDPAPMPMPMDDSMSMPMPSSGTLMDVNGWATALPFFTFMWVVMMVAMMFPAASPVVLIFDRWRKSRERSVATTLAFVAGYLLVWSVAGVLAFAAITVLDTQVADTVTAARIGGVVLVVAGVYQLTPLKRVCLSQCRSPLSLIMKHGQLLGRGLRGPLEVGLRHGAYCLGCCWALMAVLVALGVMHVGWMAAVATLILAEKVLPRGRVTASVVGVVLIAAGGFVVATGVGVMA
jgi:predicted metal-binding membrane protein